MEELERQVETESRRLARVERRLKEQVGSRKGIEPAEPPRPVRVFTRTSAANLGRTSLASGSRLRASGRNRSACRTVTLAAGVGWWCVRWVQATL